MGKKASHRMIPPAGLRKTIKPYANGGKKTATKYSCGGKMKTKRK